MMNKSFKLLVVILLVFVTNSFAQRRNYDIRNNFGINVGITQFDILTDNFVTEKQSGFAIGLSAIGYIENKWYDISYGIQFSQNNLNILGGMTDVDGNERLEYKFSTTQLAILLHAKILKQNLSIDFGPIVQANGYLDLKDDAQNGYFINGFDGLQAKDIRDVSKFNVNGAIGVTAGFKHFRIRAQYQYGLTNMLDKLNDLDVGDEKFKGNQSQLIVTAMVLF